MLDELASRMLESWMNFPVCKDGGGGSVQVQESKSTVHRLLLCASKID